jgi:ribonuclease E
VQTGKISRFGLLELSRQRLRPTLAETSYIPCPRCNGTGHIAFSTESSALHILRILEEEAMKENTGALHCQMPVDVATFLLNEKRSDIAKIELRHKVNLVLIPNIHLETPQHEHRAPAS